MMLNVNDVNDDVDLCIACCAILVVSICRHTRYDALRMCVGDEICQKLGQLKLFMVNRESYHE